MGGVRTYVLRTRRMRLGVCARRATGSTLVKRAPSWAGASSLAAHVPGGGMGANTSPTDKGAHIVSTCHVHVLSRMAGGHGASHILHCSGSPNALQHPSAAVPVRRAASAARSTARGVSANTARSTGPARHQHIPERPSTGRADPGVLSALVVVFPMGWS